MTAARFAQLFPALIVGGFTAGIILLLVLVALEDPVEQNYPCGEPHHHIQYP